MTIRWAVCQSAFVLSHYNGSSAELPPVYPINLTDIALFMDCLPADPLLWGKSPWLNRHKSLLKDKNSTHKADKVMGMWLKIKNTRLKKKNWYKIRIWNLYQNSWHLIILGRIITIVPILHQFMCLEKSWLSGTKDSYHRLQHYDLTYFNREMCLTISFIWQPHNPFLT